MHDGSDHRYQTAGATCEMRSMLIIATTSLLVAATPAWASLDTQCSRFSEAVMIGTGTLNIMPEDASLRYELKGVEHHDAVTVAPGVLGSAQLKAPAINMIRFEAVRTTAAGQCGHMGRYRHMVKIVRASVISSKTALNR